MEFRAPSQLGKRPRGYVPDDVAARRRGDGDGDDSDEEARRGAPKSGTERAVEAALAAEAAAKDQSAAAKQAAKKAAKKSVSFKEPADEEEEEAGMTQAAAEAAAAKRAAQRRGLKDIGGTDMLDDVTLAEERGPAAAAAEEEGAFEPFNLDAERAAGDFDADGNYTERRAAAADAAEDAWLEGVPVAEAMADKCRREAEAEAAKPDKLSEAQLGAMKAEIATLLQPGETVLRALKRMGASGGAGGGAGAAAAGRGRGRGRGASTVAPEHRAAFERLTELSSLLMAFGEYDVYAFSRESFERAARAHAAAAQPLDIFGGGDADGDGEDIFADAPPAKRHAGPDAPAVGAAASAAAPAAAAPDFGAWSVAQLRRFLDARGGAAAARSAVEKGELVAAAAAAASAAGLAVPPGYTWVAESGLYASGATEGLFYDLCTGAFADAQGSWYAWDAARNAFVPWTAAAPQ